MNEIQYLTDEQISEAALVVTQHYMHSSSETWTKEEFLDVWNMTASLLITVLPAMQTENWLQGQ